MSAECEVVSEELGLRDLRSRGLESTAISQLGTAKTVKVDKDNTTIINGSNRRTSRTASPRSRGRSNEV